MQTTTNNRGLTNIYKVEGFGMERVKPRANCQVTAMAGRLRQGLGPGWVPLALKAKAGKTMAAAG